MKNLLVLIIISVFGLCLSNAQEVTIGGKVGFNLSSISGYLTDGSSLESRKSFHFGVFTEVAISDRFSLQPELLYSMQGYKKKGDGYSQLKKINYLNLPILAKYYVFDSFSIEAGPQLGMLMSAKSKWRSDIESGVNKIVDYDKKLDLAIALGLGYKMETGLSFGIRYNLGLSYFDNYSSSDIGIYNKHSVFHVSIGYIF